MRKFFTESDNLGNQKSLAPHGVGLLSFYWVLVKERMRRVHRCRVVRLREGWFNSTKGVAYGQVLPT